MWVGGVSTRVENPENSRVFGIVNRKVCLYQNTFKKVNAKSPLPLEIVATMLVHLTLLSTRLHVPTSPSPPINSSNSACISLTENLLISFHHSFKLTSLPLSLSLLSLSANIDSSLYVHSLYLNIPYKIRKEMAADKSLALALLLLLATSAVISESSRIARKDLGVDLGGVGVGVGAGVGLGLGGSGSGSGAGSGSGSGSGSSSGSSSASSSGSSSSSSGSDAGSEAGSYAGSRAGSGSGSNQGRGHGSGSGSGSGHGEGSGAGGGSGYGEGHGEGSGGN